MMERSIQMSVYKAEATENEMKQEAVRRLRLLKLSETVVRSFESDGLVSLSQEVMGEIFLQSSDSGLEELIVKFQREYQCLVYHAILNDIPGMGEKWSLLFVSPAASDWEGERKQMSKNRLVYAYMISDMETGIGGIVVEPAGGGLRRIA